MNATTSDRLPTRPLRDWLRAWQIWTGDSPATIALGFDLEEALVEDLLSARPPLMLEMPEAIEGCAALRIDPAEFWPDAVPLASSPPPEAEPPWSDIPTILRNVFSTRLAVAERSPI